MIRHRLQRRANRRKPRRVGSLDWEAVRARLAATGATLDGLSATPVEILEQVWARRAERVARVPEAADEGEQLWLVIVRLGRELYGLDARNVVDIRPAGRITPVPRVPDWVAGMVNVRGRILSAVDLQRFFDLPTASDAPPDGRCLVVVAAAAMELAFLVDDVPGVTAVPRSRLLEGAGIVRGLPSEYVHGIVEYAAGGPGALVDVLNLHAVLAEPRLIIHEELA